MICACMVVSVCELCTAVCERTLGLYRFNLMLLFYRHIVRFKI